MALLNDAKLAMRITTTAYDSEIESLCTAAVLDLQTAGVKIKSYNSASAYAVGDVVSYSGTIYICNTAIETTEEWTSDHWTEDALIKRAIITYVRANFGTPDDYEKVKAAYDEQKAQLAVHTGYTDWCAS